MLQTSVQSDVDVEAPLDSSNHVPHSVPSKKTAQRSGQLVSMLSYLIVLCVLCISGLLQCFYINSLDEVFVVFGVLLTCQSFVDC